ncbi:hypothetical protein APHAL10511_001264 [Amanita phalloides]|nr:hypothetical protein APHAL10511_001264 [Amanita phalloides]
MSATANVKAKAKQWVKELLHGNSDDKKPATGTSSSSSPYTDLNLVQSFNTISLAGNNLEPSFVGGFHPALASNHELRNTPAQIYASPGPLPRPPAIPLPLATQQGNFSKTMQYALSGEYQAETNPSRPVKIDANTPKASQRFASSPSTGFASPTSEQKESCHPPTTSSLTQQQNQCAAFTKAGKQCTRRVKLGTYCFQHVKEINLATGFYARRNGMWIEYKNWIPDHLLPETQAMLRAEMEKARSSNDVPGYIYTFEIRGDCILISQSYIENDKYAEPNSCTIKFKVGRATNHVRRLDQWGKQCGSKEQIRLGIYPNPDTDDSSNLRGLQELDETRKAAWCHRLERLIHLELGDIIATKVYLDPTWPNASAPTTGSPLTDLAREDKQVCSDCGCAHKEIFEFERVTKGRYKSKEYELIVKPIIEKWGGGREKYQHPDLTMDLSQIQTGSRPQNGADEEAKRLQEEQMRRDLIATILDNAARERLSRIALVSPERSKRIEDLIISLAQGGKLKVRVTESQLIDLLEQLEDAQGKSTSKKSTIVFQRKKDIDDDLDF